MCSVLRAAQSLYAAAQWCAMPGPACPPPATRAIPHRKWSCNMKRLFMYVMAYPSSMSPVRRCAIRAAPSAYAREMPNVTAFRKRRSRPALQPRFIVLLISVASDYCYLRAALLLALAGIGSCNLR